MARKKASRQRTPPKKTKKTKKRSKTTAKKPPAKKPPKKKAPLDPASLTITQAADLLGLPRETVRDHILAGAPPGKVTRAKVNLISYTAWLLVEIRGKKHRGANGV